MCVPDVFTFINVLPGASDSEVNSTEISTDSEFDDEQPQRVPPSFHLEFKPLVEVDPTIKLVQNRAPLAVPRPGDYVLSKTASTEGIASKKSLELKKKYLLGEGTTGLGILKSGSASALDSKFKSFHSNITECQKLLNPAPQISPTMQTFLKHSTTNTPSVDNRAREESSVPVPPAESVNDTEKENVYEGKRTGPVGNVNGSSGSALAGANKRSSLIETINTTLVENKLNEIKSNESFPLPAKEEQKGEQPADQQPQSQHASPVTKVKHPPLDSDDGVDNGHQEHTAKLRNTLNNNHNNANNNNNNTNSSSSSNSNHSNNANNNNNNNNNDGEVIEIINLITPEKVKDASPTHRSMGPANETMGGLVEHKYITSMKHAYIDLTTDSPNCDRSLVETTLDFSIAPSKVGLERPTHSSAVPDIISSMRIDRNENKIEQHGTNGAAKPKFAGKVTPPPEQQQQQQPAPGNQQQQQQQQGEDGCHETTLQVPDVPWTRKEEEIESDSISESGSNSSEISSSSSTTSSSSGSSTSSVEDIPHFILDSTTSPETQTDERFVPRLEVRDATGELMQIDSLMIIDGRYIGDPEDLKLMEKLPPDTQIAAQMLQAEINQDSISTVVLEGSGPTDAEADAKQDPRVEGECASTPTTADPVRPAPSDRQTVASLSNFVSLRNPCFKFDSRNENKIDTLKNLPFVLDADQRSTLQKSMHLNLSQHKPAVDGETDTEQTPMAGDLPAVAKLGIGTPPGAAAAATAAAAGPRQLDADSDSQDDTEVTTQNNLTETELSDWAADDAVSENFVDLEFALNSNKGTIRRNHKPKHLRLHQHPSKKGVPSNDGEGGGPVRYASTMQPARNGLAATEDGIIRNLALEDIEFMDTGSEEESCIETYSTTNRMMLKNRGYMEIMDPCVESKRTVYPPAGVGPMLAQPPKLVEAINNQIAGRQMDYIEQGSYLLANDDAKTPMNEEPVGKITFSALAAAAGQTLKQAEPVGSVESAHDIEEDSLLLVSTSQGTVTGTATNSAATNDESDAPTMVVAPPSGVAPHETDAPNTAVPPTTGSSGRGSAASFTSSLQHAPTSNSNGQYEPEHTTRSSSRSRDESPKRKISLESLSGKRSSLERKDVRRDSLKSIEDIGYEKYVKRLQQKIQQISNARDSLEVKKSKRKSSKGEMVLTLSEAAKEAEDKGGAPNLDGGRVVCDSAPARYDQPAGSFATDSPGRPVPEPPKSVEKKIEEITKERVKQKDLIHDLVMDKLQTKKQLNAEKRLNRSRNRSNVLVGQAGASASGAVAGTVDTTVHEQPAVTASSDVRELAGSVSCYRTGVPGALKEVERIPLAVTSNQPHVYRGAVSLRALPSAMVPGLISTTASGCDALKENILYANGKLPDHHSSSVKPTVYQQQLITPRPNHGEPDQPMTTEQLREEARSRARLKSNQDLGLSPEDRLLLLRKKYHIAMHSLTDDEDAGAEPNKSDDAKRKDQQHRTKLNTSKSVNDVSMLKQRLSPPGMESHRHHLHHQHHHHHHHDQPGTGANVHCPTGGERPAVHLSDYISDPNLMHSSTAEPDAEAEVRLRARGGAGAGGKRKNRERRKSIIEKMSEFFNGRKKGEGSKEPSPTKDRPSLLSANGGPSDTATNATNATTTSSTGGGGFLRFKISPKLKDKSKTKESSPYGRCASDDCLTSSNGPNGLPAVATSPAAPADPNAGLHHHNSYTPIGRKEAEELEPPPIPPLPLNYERSDDEAGAANESKNELKKIRAMSKTSRQAELKRLRIAQEIQREQEEIDVKIKDLETRGVEIEKELRGESETLKKPTANLGANDEGLVKEWLEIMSSITRLKVRDDELSIRKQELQLEHRHAQLKEELNMRLSYGKLDKNSSDVAAEGAILNEMLEIVAKRQALRPSPDTKATAAAVAAVAAGASLSKPNATFAARMPNDADI